MLDESAMLTSVAKAEYQFPEIARQPLCDKLQFVYDVLMELKHKSPWHIAIGIRAVHGLITKTRRAVRC